MPLTDEQLKEILKKLKEEQQTSKGLKGTEIIREDPAPIITNEDILRRIEEIKATLRKGA
jgi:hypothetical protein